MEIRFENRDEFIVHGYTVETILSSCDNDVGLMSGNYGENTKTLY